MKQTYNKLVRDKIIDIIISNGETHKSRVLSNEEYLEELHRKLFEEANEFIEEDSPEEMADLLEVVYSIAELKNIDLNEVERIRKEKRQKRGGFENKIYLETVEKN
ncbi:MAG: nucleoside triphosphate pyrophosphohydrolase [Clostridia bacterium]|nr:nucleoside triphosphate pyrophosphohydrolase [Clostridia bacterium]